MQQPSRNSHDGNRGNCLPQQGRATASPNRALQTQQGKYRSLLMPQCRPWGWHCPVWAQGQPIHLVQRHWQVRPRRPPSWWAGCCEGGRGNASRTCRYAQCTVNKVAVAGTMGPDEMGAVNVQLGFACCWCQRGTDSKAEGLTSAPGRSGRPPQCEAPCAPAGRSR